MQLVDPQEFISMRASRGIVKDFPLTTHTDYSQPPVDYNVLRAMSENDGLINSALQLTTDMVTNNGFEIIGKNKRAITEFSDRLEHDLDYDNVIANITYQLLLYGDAYLELVFDGTGTVTELHPLETSEMKLDFDKHGQVKRIIQVPLSNVKKEIIFDPETIVRYTFRNVGSRVYSDTMMRSIASVWSTRNQSLYYLKQLFKNNPQLAVHLLRGADKNAKKEFLADLDFARQRAVADVVVYGMNDKSDHKVTEVGARFQAPFVEHLKELRKEVLTIFRIPPHWMGMLDGANRGIGENVTIPFEAQVKKIQHRIDSQNNRELLPKLGEKNLKIRFKPPTIVDEKLIIANAQTMKGLGLDSETVIEYMKEKGYPLRPGAVIEDPEPEPDSGKEIDDGKMKTNLNKDGTSDAGKAKLVKKQEAKK